MSRKPSAVQTGMEDDALLVPVSALQHYVYCPRQCALIHLEQTFEENVHTLRGHRAHESVDEPTSEQIRDVRVERALPIWSDRLGLIGRADWVEFLADGTPYPIEHKVGPRRARLADEIQLCAQAMCLEEMLGRHVPRGAIYHHRSRRRREVVFDQRLREEVERVTAEVRSLLREGRTPPPVRGRRCERCSLVEWCMPHATQALGQVKEDTS